MTMWMANIYIIAAIWSVSAHSRKCEWEELNHWDQISECSGNAAVWEYGSGLCKRNWKSCAVSGDSSASGTNKTAVTEQATQAVTQAASQQTSTESYILNTNTKKFLRPSCSSVKQMKESNKKSSSESRDALIAAGYDPCKKCNP